MKTYYPEMNQTKPEAQIEMTVGSNCKYLKTTLQLKGRGINLYDTLNEKKYYRVTDTAFKKIKSQFNVVAPLSL